MRLLRVTSYTNRRSARSALGNSNNILSHSLSLALCNSLGNKVFDLFIGLTRFRLVVLAFHLFETAFQILFVVFPILGLWFSYFLIVKPFFTTLFSWREKRTDLLELSQGIHLFLDL